MGKIVPLDQIQGTMPRVGKLSAGYMESKTVNGRVVTYPAKSRTLVFRCSSPDILRAASKIIGGTVSKSPNPRAEGAIWRLVSEATDLDVLIASDDRQDAPARYEAWGASGKIRECDGHICRFLIDPKTGERRDNVPCWCASQALEAEDADACRITTRLNLFVPAFVDIPGIGVWQLESRGRTTYQDLKGLRDLFQRMGLPGAMGAPVTLRVDIVRRRSPGSGDPQEFPVFRFQSKLSLTDTLARAREFGATAEPARLPAPDDSTPPLGAVLDTEQESLASASPLVDARTTLPDGDGRDTHAAAPSTRPGTAPAPHAGEPVTSPAGSTDNLGAIIAQAAAAEGYPNGREWIKAHFGLTVTTPDQIPADRAAQVRALADEVRELRDLIARAAQAQGCEGPDLVGHWLGLHYLASKIADLTEEQRADARARATSLLTTHASAPASVPVQPATRNTTPATRLPHDTNGDQPSGQGDAQTVEPQPAPAHGNDEPAVLGPDAAKRLRALIAEAAGLEGFKGKSATRAWATAHYGLTNGKLEDVAPELRIRMRQDALASIAARKHPANGEAAAGVVPAATSASGNGPSAAAPQADASARRPTPAGTIPASAEQLEAIQRECAIRGIIKPQDNPGIAQSARRDITQFEELTQAEADRVLRYLKYVPLRTAHASPA